MSTCGVAECKKAATFRCGRCMTASYCSTDHQATDWKAGHRDVCVKNISGNPTKRPAKGKKASRKTRPGRIAAISKQLADALRLVNELLDNPLRESDTGRPDLMEKLLQLKTFIEEATDLQRERAKAEAEAAAISGTLVPFSAYQRTLESIKVALQTLINDTATIDSDQLERLEQQVAGIISRVREILLNPEIWIGMAESGMPADLLRLITKYQPVYELEKMPRKVLYAQAMPFSPDDRELTSVVSDNQIYRFGERRMTLNGTPVEYGILGAYKDRIHVPLYPVFRAFNFPYRVFVPGLFGTLWAVGPTRAINVRYGAGQWQLIRAVEYAELDESDRVFGVDQYDRLWMARVIEGGGFVISAIPSPDPSVPVVPLSEKLNITDHPRINSAAMTKKGLILNLSSRVGVGVEIFTFRRIDISASGEVIVEELTPLLDHAKYKIEPVVLTGHRTSTQLIVTQKPEIWVWDLETNTTLQKLRLPTVEVETMEIGPDQRSLIVDTGSYRDPDAKVFKLY